MGRDFTIFRSMGQKPSIRTEQHDSRWLNGMYVYERVSSIKLGMFSFLFKGAPKVPLDYELWVIFCFGSPQKQVYMHESS